MAVAEMLQPTTKCATKPTSQIRRRRGGSSKVKSLTWFGTRRGTLIGATSGGLVVALAMLRAGCSESPAIGQYVEGLANEGATVQAYHKTRLVDPVTLKRQQYTRGQFGFRELSAIAAGRDIDGLAAAAAELAKQKLGAVQKVVTELAYDAYRAEHMPVAVSRLDAVFMFENPLDAFEVAATWDDIAGDQHIWLCDVPDGTPTTVCDMDEYIVFSPSNPTDAAGWASCWNQTMDRAHSYWNPRTPDSIRELLVGGDVEMVRRVHLKSIL